MLFKWPCRRAKGYEWIDLQQRIANLENENRTLKLANVGVEEYRNVCEDRDLWEYRHDKAQDKVDTLTRANKSLRKKNKDLEDNLALAAENDTSALWAQEVAHLKAEKADLESQIDVLTKEQHHVLLQVGAGKSVRVTSSKQLTWDEVSGLGIDLIKMSEIEKDAVRAKEEIEEAWSASNAKKGPEL